MVKQKEKFLSAVNAGKTRIFAAIVLTLICAGTVFAAASSNYTVEILVDGKTEIYQTAETDAYTIVNQAGYTISGNDELDLTAFKPGENVEGNKIVVLRAYDVTINDEKDNSVQVYQVNCAGTVSSALKKAGLTISDKDYISIALDKKLSGGLVIDIKRAYVVNITADGDTKTIDFTQGTVEDALELADVTLDSDDEVVPSVQTALKAGDCITVYRVSYQTRNETKTIKYSTTTKQTSSLYLGQTQTQQAGANGSKTVTYQDKIVDGAVSKSTVVSEKVTKEVVNCIVLKGTKVKVLSTAGAISAMALPSAYSLDSDGIPAGYVDTISGKSSAYTGGGNCATGVKAQSGYVAVNPNKIPYGTKMYIVSSDGKYVYGYCVAADTGGFAYSSSKVCDLYMDTTSECYQWGARNVVIYILSWGSGSV